MKPKQSKWNSALKRFIMTVLFLSVVIGLSALDGCALIWAGSLCC